ARRVLRRRILRRCAGGGAYWNGSGDGGGGVTAMAGVGRTRACAYPTGPWYPALADPTDRTRAGVPARIRLGAGRAFVLPCPPSRTAVLDRGCVCAAWSDR